MSPLSPAHLWAFCRVTVAKIMIILISYMGKIKKIMWECGKYCFFLCNLWKNDSLFAY